MLPRKRQSLLKQPQDFSTAPVLPKILRKMFSKRLSSDRRQHIGKRRCGLRCVPGTLGKTAPPMPFFCEPRDHQTVQHGGATVGAISEDVKRSVRKPFGDLFEDLDCEFRASAMRPFSKVPTLTPRSGLRDVEPKGKRQTPVQLAPNDSEGHRESFTFSAHLFSQRLSALREDSLLACR